jgi:hypothetical protein
MDDPQADSDAHRCMAAAPHPAGAGTVADAVMRAVAARAPSWAARLEGRVWVAQPVSGDDARWVFVHGEPAGGALVAGMADGGVEVRVHLAVGAGGEAVGRAVAALQAAGVLPGGVGVVRCRRMETRACPPLGCEGLPCARLEDDDESRWSLLP